MENNEKKVKFDIDNGNVFFADEIGIIHNPLRIMLDFRSVTPRVDIRNQEFQPIVIKHNVVILDPFMAKNLLELLKQNIANYEKQFGKIKQPEQLRKINRKQKKSNIKNETNIEKNNKNEKTPAYLG
ncbi:MAG: DUF3467 domain-containing protein [Candidatus Woesearchaeota archaeon]